MLCSKVGGECPHAINFDEKLIFVMMPFRGFNSVYDAIKISVKEINSEFKCERADDKYTNLSIWCNRICKNIRKAKYLIVDTTGKNPNVFYELGFSHALANTKAIIITQSVEDAPFDISDINHIVYSEKELPELRKNIVKALNSLESEDKFESYSTKTSDEVIRELKNQLLKEEERSANFKKELIESERRENKLAENILEIESIQNNPVKEAENKIVELEGIIAELKSKLKFVEKDKKEELEKLRKTIEEKEAKLKNLEDNFNNYKNNNDTKSLSKILMDDAKKRSEAKKWFNEGCTETQNSKKIEYYTKAIDLDPDFILAYINRGLCYGRLSQYEKATKDFDNAIELDPKSPLAYTHRGSSFYDLEKYKEAIGDYGTAIKLDSKYFPAYFNRGLTYIKLNQYEKAIKDMNIAIQLNPYFSKAYNSKGIIYGKMKQFSEAIKEYTKAIEIEPDYFMFYRNLAELYIIIGDYEKAQEYIKKALALSSEYKDKIICVYLKSIVFKMLNYSTKEVDKEFDRIMEKNFSLNYSFDEIELWLKNVKVREEVKKYISNKIEKLKKYIVVRGEMI